MFYAFVFKNKILDYLENLLYLGKRTSVKNKDKEIIKEPLEELELSKECLPTTRSSPVRIKDKDMLQKEQDLGIYVRK